MSQHDLDIANQGFPATRADLNLALKALGSLQSGATAPSTTYANMLWYDTANNILKIRNEDNDAFISLFTLDQSADNIEALTINGTLTATGAFTSPGIDDNADATAITIDSNESVLIGKTSEAIGTAGAEFRASGHQLNMTRASGPALNVNRLTDDGGLLGFYKDSATVGSIGANASRVYMAGPSRGIKFGNSSMNPVTASGQGADNSVDLGDSSTRFKDLYLSGGAYLGGTGSANKLDDYEEGNFEVTVASGITVSSYDQQLGHYVKVGRQVTAWVFMEYNGSSRTSSQFIIAGLPFTSSNDTSNEATFGGFITYQSGFSSAHNIIHVPRNNTQAFFYELDGSDLIGNELSGPSGEVRFVVQYTVA